MKSKLVLPFALCILCLMYLMAPPDTRCLMVETADGETIQLYEKSYALVIGVSDYTSAWPDLDVVPQEIADIESVLVKLGFEITRVMNPDSNELEAAFENFVDSYGYNKNNQLHCPATSYTELCIPM